MMSTSKLHSSLPTPLGHSSHLSSSQSKSTVLAGVQDAYWSDDEAEDAECPLCLEEMDVSDLNFKPCPCGYQVCSFCWHHIKENLNGRCPACRREYSDATIKFKVLDKEDHKRLTQQKKQKERERKDLDTLGRRHLLNVRVVQRNVVYVVGLGSRFAKEELIPTLRSNEYFGQYGKITKILIVKKTPPGSRTPVVGLYITYYRREDAIRAISDVDGSPSPSGNGEVMRASYGTTKYCIAFLRGISCTNNGCMDLHDWGDEKDCFTKEDLTTLKHTMKDTESRRDAGTGKKQEDGSLPRNAGWAQKSTFGGSSLSNIATSSTGRDRDGPHRSTRRGHRATRSGAVGGEGRSQPSASRQHPERKPTTSTKASSQASSSRPPTPAVSSLPQRPATPVLTSVKSKIRRDSQNLLPPRSPTSSIAVESDLGSVEATSASPALSPPNVSAIPASIPATPPGLPAAPPGLATSNSGSRPSSAAAVSTVARESSSSSYQMSMQAQALLDDVRNRRESLIMSTSFSPFPDLDRTLQVLTGGDGDTGGFNFNLDPKLAVDDDQFDASLPDLDSTTGGFFDPFPPMRASFGSPPGLSYSPTTPRFYDNMRPPSLEKASSTSSGYTGSFNPFGETNDAVTQPVASRTSPLIEDDVTRRMSRFGFARERQGAGLSVASSPLLSANTSQSSATESLNTGTHAPWTFQRHHEFGPPPGLPMRSGTPASRGSPLASFAVTPSSYVPQASRFQPFDMGTSEPSLKDLFGIGRERSSVTHEAMTNEMQIASLPGMPFQDPAVMSSVPYMSPPTQEVRYSTSPRVSEFSSPFVSMNTPPTPAFQQPQQFHQLSQPMLHSQPALPGSQILSHVQSPVSSQGPLASTIITRESSPEPSPVLSAADFPALPTPSAEATARTTQVSQPHIMPTLKEERVQSKPDRKAQKKAALAEKALERERIAKERAAEKERLARERAEERSRVEKEKAEKERLNKQKADADNLAGTSLNGTSSKSKTHAKNNGSSDKQTSSSTTASKSAIRSSTAKPQAGAPPVQPDAPLPMLSKMPKKSRPVTKPIKIPKEDDSQDGHSSNLPSAVAPSAETPQLPNPKLPNVSEIVETPEADGEEEGDHGSRVETPSSKPKSLAELLEEIGTERGRYYIDNHPFFDPSRINPSTKITLDYNTMVRALSAFPIDSETFKSTTRLNDKTVASFQQLLETLTQTMSDLVQLLPQNTWGSIFDVLSQDLKDLKRDYSQHSSVTFDGLVHDDLPEDVDEEEYDLNPPTPTMEKRAKWMEVQLAKLEELHREVNTAAIRAILSLNDRGWDVKGFLPHVGNTLSRFDHLGMVDEDGALRKMTIEELEKKLVVAKEAVVFAETEMKEAMQAMQVFKP